MFASVRPLVLVLTSAATLGCQAATGDDFRANATANHLPRLSSASLCADSYLLALAPDAQIGTLSWQAGTVLSTAGPDHDSGLWEDREILAAQRRAYPTETIISGPGRALPSVGLTLNFVEDLPEVLDQAERIASLANSPPLNIETLRQDIAALETLPAPSRAPRILYLSRAGGTSGPESYVGAAITRAGGTNVIESGSWQSLTPERILRLDPDIVLTSFFGSDYAGVNDRALRHAALSEYIADKPRIDVPGKLWPCAGPGLVEATQRIHAGIMAWDAEAL